MKTFPPLPLLPPPPPADPQPPLSQVITRDRARLGQQPITARHTLAFANQRPPHTQFNQSQARK